MTWKTEKWIAELFPGEERVYEEYRLLPTRELIIVAAAVLDAALAELLAKRFRSFPAEAESFLGVNRDGRAPAASFGSRIQLAVLLGIITPEDAAVLRALRNLRNTFAHRANADLLVEPALGQTRALLSAWRSLAERLIEAGVLHGSVKSVSEIEEHLGVLSEAGEGLVLACFSTFQAYFFLLDPLVERVDLIRRRKPEHAEEQ
jgi:hypothetical protein